MAANPSEVRRGPSRQRGSAAGQSAPRRPAPKKLPWWRKIYKDWGATAGLALAAAAIVTGIMGRDERRVFADEGLGYALGIVGTLLILFLLIYPLRKRFKWLKVLGNVRNWFRVHMILGVVGPLTILYHSNFMLGSVNSTVALLAMPRSYRPSTPLTPSMRNWIWTSLKDTWFVFLEVSIFHCLSTAYSPDYAFENAGSPRPAIADLQLQSTPGWPTSTDSEQHPDAVS